MVKKNRFEQIYQVEEMKSKPGDIQLVLLSKNGNGAMMESYLRTKTDEFIPFSKNSKLAIGDFIKVTVEHTGRSYKDTISDEE